MENYNFNPISHDEFYTNAELLVSRYLKFDGISDYHYKRNNIAIYHTITIDKNGYKTVEDITDYFESKPTAQKDITISQYIEDKKNRRQHDRTNATRQ